MRKSKTINLTVILVISLLLVYLLISSFGIKKNVNENNIEKELETYNYSLSTQTIGSKYKFTNETMLVETAKEIKNMGSNLLKFSMHPRYCTENYGLPKKDAITSLTKLAQIEPSMKKVLDMDFKYYHIWAYGFSQYTPEPEGEKDDTSQIKFIDGFDKKHEDALYDEMYDFATYLLNTYNNTGKVFYLGNWEGDWHLRSDYERDKPVNPKTLKGMIKWAKVRQKAIDDAKKDTQHNNVELYHYIEVNLVKIALENPEHKVVTNSVLPKVNPDYVSYSAYDATNPYKTEAKLNEKLKESLNFLESQLSPKPDLPEGKRVWIGEYGNPSAKYGDASQNQRSIWTIKAGLEWGSPYILYWEMYNNEIKPKTGEQVGYWLITDEGVKQPIWHTHNNFYKESQTFVKDYYQRNDEVPSFDVFRKNALDFKSLNP